VPDAGGLPQCQQPHPAVLFTQYTLRVIQQRQPERIVFQLIILQQ
jgi:hypothetical protein